MRKLLVAVGVLVLLLLAADRVAPVVAGGIVAKRVGSEAELSTPPEVTFHGFPFLTQAVGGRYDDVQVTARGVRVGALRGIEVDSHFRGLHAPLGDVIGRNLQTVPIDRIGGTARIGYADLVRAADLPQGVTVDSVSRDGDGLRINGTARFAGRSVTASATASVGVSGDALVVTAKKVTFDEPPDGVPGMQVPADQLSFSVPMRGLPFHLRITDVRPADDGLRVSAEARDVVFGQGGLSPIR